MLSVTMKCLLWTYDNESSYTTTEEQKDSGMNKEPEPMKRKTEQEEVWNGFVTSGFWEFNQPFLCFFFQGFVSDRLLTQKWSPSGLILLLLLLVCFYTRHWQQDTSSPLFFPKQSFHVFCQSPWRNMNEPSSANHLAHHVSVTAVTLLLTRAAALELLAPTTSLTCLPPLKHPFLMIVTVLSTQWLEWL